MSYRFLRTICLSASIATLALAAAAVPTAAIAQAQTIQFSIPAGNRAQALMDFSRQAGVQILFPYDAVAGLDTPAISGTFTRSELLKRLLDGTSLVIASESDTVITLKVAGPKNDSASKDAAKDEPREELIITGSHIRDANPTSPVHTITRKDIDQSGYAQIGDVIRSLPENFSGGQNPGVIAADPGASGVNSNYSNASTANLRGLGSDATLTLVNGHRTSGEALYQASDMSGVPLAAVSRIEVVTDGASALYGSDAVAGVVNILLRRDYDGGEVSARVGSSAQGGGEDRSVSLLWGRSGSDWHLLGNYEYYDQKPVYASQRSFLSEVVPTNTVLRGMQRNSVFLSGHKDFSDRISLNLDVLFGDRNTQDVQQSRPTTRKNSNYTWTPNYSTTLSADIGLAGDWKLRVDTSLSGSRNVLWTHAPNYYSQFQFKNLLEYLEAKADGTVLHGPGGDIKAAIGGGRRSEAFQFGIGGTSSYFEASRDVDYLFAEVNIPAVTPSAERPGLNSLEFSVSARAESYSDLGSTTNPKVGFRWVPHRDFTVRGTWGTSFKAPSFYQLYGPTYVVHYPTATFGGTGGGTAMLTQGGNSALEPETSESRTIGVDYRPSNVPTLKLTATYFDIDYKDRVVVPIPQYTRSLRDPTFAPFVQNSPSASLQAEAITRAGTGYFNLTGAPYDPTNVVALIFDQYVNATSQKINGIDLGYRQQFDIQDGVLSLFGNATWMRLEQKTLPTLPDKVLSGTVFNSPDLKARAGVDFARGAFNAVLIANYVSDGLDTGVAPAAPIKSWTTVDTTLSYRFPAQKIRVSLAISNLFDERPPYVRSPSITTRGYYFDSTNSSAMGRFTSLYISKAW